MHAKKTVFYDPPSVITAHLICRPKIFVPKRDQAAAAQEAVAAAINQQQAGAEGPAAATGDASDDAALEKISGAPASVTATIAEDVAVVMGEQDIVQEGAAEEAADAMETVQDA